MLPVPLYLSCSCRAFCIRRIPRQQEVLTASLGRWVWTRSSVDALRSIDSVITGIRPFLLGGVLFFLLPCSR